MYTPNEHRYEKMVYNRCGKSGLKLPAVSLGIWQNFGYKDSFDNMEEMVHTAFDLGITHIDAANNYGNPYNGSAEENLGKILDRGMRQFRDELVISTKAGYEMWDGPYGDRNGSRKYLTASLDQSLKRMKLDYVDIFYHHIFDPNTPLEETALALDNAVRQGKALYVGISNYNKAQTAEIMSIFKELRTPFIVNQPSYSMLNRWIESDGLRDFAAEQGIGLSVFSPLYQGLLTDRYLNGIPSDSRIATDGRFLKASQLTEEKITSIRGLNEIAKERGESLAQMALNWVLKDGIVTSVLVGASKPEQILDNLKVLESAPFTDEELKKIDALSLVHAK